MLAQLAKRWRLIALVLGIMAMAVTVAWARAERAGRKEAELTASLWETAASANAAALDAYRADVERQQRALAAELTRARGRQAESERALSELLHATPDRTLDPAGPLSRYFDRLRGAAAPDRAGPPRP